jgi:hypothetical protein
LFLRQGFQFINIIESEFVSLDIYRWWLRVTQINLLVGAGSSHVELVFRDLIARTVFPRDGERAIYMALLVSLEQVVLRDHAVLRTGLRDTPL